MYPPRIIQIGGLSIECNVSKRRPAEPYNANSFEELFEKYGMPHVDRLRKLGRIGIVCGPISTPKIAGLTTAQTVKVNLRSFNQAIIFTQYHMESVGLCNVLDQMGYEEAIKRLVKREIDDGGYAHDILDRFYLPLFKYACPELGFGVFMPGWRESIGASWEHDTLGMLGVERVYLPEDWQVRALALGIYPTSPY